MGKIVIKKRISLDFLGDEYKDCYITFKPITISEADKIGEEAIQSTKDRKSNAWLLEQLKNRFLEGKFLDADNNLFELKADDIDNLDLDTCSTIFEILTGQTTHPKV